MLVYEVVKIMNLSNESNEELISVQKKKSLNLPLIKTNMVQ